ncbi:MAG: NACHT domain-containing NTPase [Xenococcaceae cyanobacterium]
MLLCRIWTLNQGQLPETRAEFYQRYLPYFYNWKKNIKDLTEEDELQAKLHKALGELAIQGIDSGSRYRLKRSIAREAMGEELFNLAKKLGWLNIVDRDLTTNKEVYAFFHPTFQEYFAARAIDDWDFFLPRNHINKPVQGKKYRIFEPKWKEVILLWLGREDINKKEKEDFINALVKFEDGCSSSIFWFIRKKRRFYQYRAYFLAAAGINEFKEYSRTKEIVTQVVKWAFGKLIRDITSSAETSLTETNRTEAIEGLIKVIDSTTNESTRRQAAESLEKIAPGNPKAIEGLIKLIDSTTDESTRRQAAESLEKIGAGNPKAIEGLIKVINSTTDESTRRQAAESLGEILTKSLMPKAISVLKNYQEQEAVKVLWDCAQNLSYPEFYQAWNRFQIFVTAIKQELIKLTKPVRLIYIDCHKFSNSYHPIVSSYEQMLEQKFPKTLHGLPYTIEKFKKYWYTLQRNSDKELVLIFYDPLNKLSPAFLDACSKFDGKICIVSNSSTPDLQHFSFSKDNKDNLSEAIIDWIENKD